MTDCSTCRFWSPPKGKGKRGNCTHHMQDLFSAVKSIKTPAGVRVSLDVHWTPLRPEDGEGCQCHEATP